MVEKSSDLEGNIKLDTVDVEEADNDHGFQPEERPSSAASSTLSAAQR